jgi:hypothetical protein
LEFRAREWEQRVKDIPIGVIPVEQAEGAIAYGLKQAAMYRDIAARFKVSMTEGRRGRGKRRRRVEEDKLMTIDEAGEGEGDGDGDEIEFGDEDELDDLCGDVSDEEFLLGGGEDDD